jgi:hypothetical protein
MKNRPVFLLYILACLSGGVFIYISSRSSNIFLNQWLASLSGGKILHVGQALFQHFHLPGWVLYSLPDALWMSSLTMLILVIWDFKLYRQSIFWLMTAVLSGLLFEILQAFHILPGTFDTVDLIFLIGGALCPVSLTLINARL